MDAAPQSHVMSTKKEYPTKDEDMGYPTLPEAPLDSTRRQRKDKWGDQSTYWLCPWSLIISLFFTLARSPFFGFSRRVPGSTQFLQEVLAKC
jgi:hypothetical protein